MARTLESLIEEGWIRTGGQRRGIIGRQYPQSVHENCGYLSIPVGVSEIDAALPEGGLKPSATHEWFAPPFDHSARSAWAPPLTILATIATRASAESGDLLVWVGRRCWPMPATIGAAMARSILVDPEGDEARFWTIDQALRCPGVTAVIADATRLDMAGSRRLQLAAEAGGTIGLLARPLWERGVISAAETRWLVTPEPVPLTTPPRLSRESTGAFVGVGLSATATESWPRWSLELLRCKGASLAAQEGRWVVEWRPEAGRETNPLRVPPDVERGLGEKAPAPLERRTLRIA
jgi:protein ImuA